ncbi:hypothetical protein [Pseudoclavibacter sp. 8L]|uniref:hypothetical protein n=1 Tax=Pseudoclavibacter sp. 8L TaxID=2653162 RepID=UPI0012F02A35|nr:hypothetical protein [Pseudoclavibacter sp. 8L]VXB29338.1 conserved hypothetical protein [Pseudoclavibacter sp. 8L]
MSREIRIPGVEFSGPGFQDPPVDDLADSAGAFLYMDLSHPELPVTGVPASVPNLVAETAAALAAASTPASITLTSAFTSSSGRTERTAKGGLHIVPSKVNDVAAQTFQAQMAPALATWARTQQTDWWFLSMSVRVTRAGTAGTEQQMARLGQNTSTYIASVSEGSAGTSSFGLPLPNRTSSPTPGLANLCVAAQGSGSMTNIAQSFLLGGPVNATYLHKAPSYIVYNLFIDNLTSSGRSYAESRALSGAVHSAGHSIGGRWAGDTWSAPADLIA